MSFKTIRSESLGPLFVGLSLMACMGVIPVVLAMEPAVSSAAPRTPQASAAHKPPYHPASPERWTDWRWGREDGGYYIEYNWQHRNKMLAAR
jgi:hypothetical protein